MLNLKSKNANSQTFYNFFSTVIRSGIAFITMPLFTRLLGAEQFGKYSVYASWLSIIVCFMGCNVASSIGTGFYKFRDYYYKFKTSILVEGTVISIIIFIICLIFSKQISSIIGYPVIIFILMLVEAIAHFIVNFASGSWVYEKKALYNMLLSLEILVFTTILSIILLVVFNDRLPELFYSRVIGSVIPYILTALVIWIIFFKHQPYGFNYVYWKYSLLFGLPMIFHTLSSQVLGQSDRVMMEKMGILPTDIGIYSFFYSFVALLSTIMNALNNSWSPFFYDGLYSKDYDKLNKNIKNYVHLFVTLVCGFLLLANEVVKVFANDEYWKGMPLVPILVLVVYFTYIYQFAVNYEFFNSKPRIIAIGTGGAALANIILNVILIPEYGMYGAAIATLISYVLLACFHILTVKTWKLERYPLKLKPLFIGLLVIIIFSAAYYLLEDYWVLRWGTGIILGAFEVFRIWKRKTIF